MNPWLTAPVRSLKVMVSDLSQFRGLLQQSHQSLHKDRQYLRAGITQRPYYIQQKGNGLVSSPAFSISWWCYTRSCSSEAQRHWHSLWSPALLMLMKMRFIISNTTGSQYAIQNANVILDCSQTRGEVLGNEWRWLKSIHADKKKKAQMPSHVTLTSLISQGEDSAGAVSTLHNKVVSDTAYGDVTQHCPLDAVLCRYLWSVGL